MMNIKWIDESNKTIESKVTTVKITKNHRVIITIIVDYNAFRAILERENFHLSKDVIINQSRKNFEDKDVELDLALSPKLIEDLINRNELTEDKIKEYITNESSEEYISTNNWYVLNVKQEEKLPPELEFLGSVKTGFSTKWNENL